MSHLHDVARELRAVASNYPAYTPDRTAQVVAVIDGLTIKCIADAERINAVADKYDDAAHNKGPHRRQRWNANDRRHRIAVGRIK